MLAVTLMAMTVLILVFAPVVFFIPYMLLTKYLMPSKPFLDMNICFKNNMHLKSNWEIIEKEVRQLLEFSDRIPKLQDVEKTNLYITSKDNVPWRIYVLKMYGEWVEENCSKAPKTTAMLKNMPEVETAMFSIIEGGKHVRKHTGFFNGVARYQLGLIIPKDAPCFIEVNGISYHWENGEDFIFDDTYPHEVFNKSDSQRVVLLCNVIRKDDIPYLIYQMNRLVMYAGRNSSFFRKSIKKSIVKWS